MLRVRSFLRSDCKIKSKQKSLFFSFLWERKGFLLTVCLQLLAQRTQKPSLIPLHVRCYCAMRRFIWHCRAANLNLTFSGCGSRRLKFTNLSKGSRGEVFLRLDAADLKFRDGSYLVGSDRA